MRPADGESGDVSRQLRVLAIAEQCNPNWESVPMVGWQHSRALARITDQHLVTHVINTENLRRAGLTEGVDFTAIDSTAVDGLTAWILERFGMSWKTGKGWTAQTAVHALTHQYFERLVWKRFGDAIIAGEYDVVHRIMPMSPVVPSRMARHCRQAGVPFVLGPLNGGLPWPAQFSSLRDKEREYLSAIRDVYKLVPGYRSTREDSDAVVVGSRATLAEIPTRYHDKCVYVPEYAVDPQRFSRRASGPYRLPLQVAFVGRFVPVKCVDVLIEAAAPLVREGTVELTLIGDGSEMPALRELVSREEIESGVTFTGWVSHDKLQDLLVEAHVFGFPSIKDLGAGAAGEAMSMGLVPVVVDYGGPGELVSPSTGFKVPLGPRDQIVRDIREVLVQIVADPAMLEPMADRGRDRVSRFFTWEAKAAQLLEIYRWVLGQRDKPDFGMPYADEVGEPPLTG